MPPIETTSDDASNWFNLIPAGRLPLIGIILFMVSTLYVVLPSRWITFMDKELAATSNIYREAVDDHTLDFQLESHRVIADRLLALDDKASSLRRRFVVVPPMLGWFIELASLIDGHLLAILLCTWKISVLKKTIQ
ncbi:hypothetical protein FB451DRAFT_1362124, partial [Mycena latifolia]